MLVYLGYSECDEVAETMDHRGITSFADACRHVREHMPDESIIVVHNVAERLVQRARWAVARASVERRS